MEDREDQANRADLISRLFALLTGKLEDAATTAAECQRRLPPDQLRDKAAGLVDLIGETVTLSAAVSALLNTTGSEA